MREFKFVKRTINSYSVYETIDGKLVDSRIMNADQVGKREGELVREGFRIYTTSYPGIRYYRKG